jgi:glutathione-independent formaldehyde dehydrogenase
MSADGASSPGDVTWTCREVDRPAFRSESSAAQEETTMRAVVYEGPRKVTVRDVPDARIERPTDVLVRVTTTNICGSDLHMYEGRTSFETGRWFGHENMGEVVEVGSGVDKIAVGDHVVLPFNVACGHCKNCERGLTNYCLTAQPVPEWAGAAYGFADMGPWAVRQ